MKKLIYFFIAFMAITNAFASNTAIVPSHLRHHTLQLNVEHIDSLMVEQCDDGTKELHVMGDADATAETAFDMGDVAKIKLLEGKDPDDKVTEIKTITIRAVEKAN